MHISACLFYMLLKVANGSHTLWKFSSFSLFHSVILFLKGMLLRHAFCWKTLCLNLLANVAGFFPDRLLMLDLSRLMGRWVYVWGDVLDLQVQFGERYQGMLEMEKNLKLVGS